MQSMVAGYAKRQFTHVYVPFHRQNTNQQPSYNELGHASKGRERDVERELLHLVPRFIPGRKRTLSRPKWNGRENCVMDDMTCLWLQSSLIDSQISSVLLVCSSALVVLGIKWQFTEIRRPTGNNVITAASDDRR